MTAPVNASMGEYELFLLLLLTKLARIFDRARLQTVRSPKSTLPFADVEFQVFRRREGSDSPQLLSS